MPRTMRVVAAPIVSSLLLVGLPGKSGALTYTRYHHYHLNICGAVCNDGSVGVANEVVSTILTRRPHIVTLNEVCFAQYSWIASRVPYYGRFTVTHEGPERCGPAGSDRRFGNATFIVSQGSTVYTAWEHPLPNPSGSKEERMLTCLNTTINGGHLFVCNTHLHPSTDTEQQVDKIVELMNGSYGPIGRAIVLAGDFNADVRNCGPRGEYLDGIYRSAYGGVGTGPEPECYLGNSTFSEVDRRRANGSHGEVNESTHGSNKLDFIFFTHRHFLVDWWGDATSSVLSDHDPLFGEYSLVISP